MTGLKPNSLRNVCPKMSDAPGPDRVKRLSMTAPFRARLREKLVGALGEGCGRISRRHRFEKEKLPILHQVDDADTHQLLVKNERDHGLVRLDRCAGRPARKNDRLGGPDEILIADLLKPIMVQKR